MFVKLFEAGLAYQKEVGISFALKSRMYILFFLEEKYMIGLGVRFLTALGMMELADLSPFEEEMNEVKRRKMV